MGYTERAIGVSIDRELKNTCNLQSINSKLVIKNQSCGNITYYYTAMPSVIMCILKCMHLGVL